MTTLLITHEACFGHDTTSGHPERPERIAAIMEALKAPEFSDLEWVEAPLAPMEMALLAHAKGYVEALDHQRPHEGLVAIDGDTIMSAGTWEAVLRGVGGACLAVDRVMTEAGTTAFCAMRPPGHHAEKDRAMGFCFFNNAAIAVRHAQQNHGIDRVAVVDFDVHHGNGTQDIFWDDESVLFCSTHQMPLYPGTGEKSERGMHGNILNVPLMAGDGSAAFRKAMADEILPALEVFKPQLIVISAGFDAHRDDPLGGLNLTEEDFGWVTGELRELANRHASGRLVSILEGGYDLNGLARSAAAHVAALAHR